MIFKLFAKFGEFVIFSARSFQIEFLDCKLEGKYLKLPKMTAIRIKLYRPISEKFLGIDFAMHGMCVFSTGGRAGYPMFYRNTEKKLAQEQRKLSRCQNWMRG